MWYALSRSVDCVERVVCLYYQTWYELSAYEMFVVQVVLNPDISCPDRAISPFRHFVISQFRCFTVSLFCIALSLFHIVSLFRTLVASHSIVVSHFCCFSVSLFWNFVVSHSRCFLFSLFCTFVVSHFRCFVLLFFCSSVLPLFHTFVVSYFRCFALYLFRITLQ